MSHPSTGEQVARPSTDQHFPWFHHSSSVHRMPLDSTRLFPSAWQRTTPSSSLRLQAT